MHSLFHPNSRDLFALQSNIPIVSELWPIQKEQNHKRWWYQMWYLQLHHSKQCLWEIWDCLDIRLCEVYPSYRNRLRKMRFLRRRSLREEWWHLWKWLRLEWECKRAEMVSKSRDWRLWESWINERLTSEESSHSFFSDYSFCTIPNPFVFFHLKTRFQTIELDETIENWRGRKISILKSRIPI